MRVDERDDQGKRPPGSRLLAPQEIGRLLGPATVITRAPTAEMGGIGVLSGVGRLPGVKSELLEVIRAGGIG